ncbi:hypothetical protein, partial [Mesorhizobium sp.]|uniref:hypothetical protein n=1 Tax=Mesorhizobium sp. TaxID=1871066 RepID=UPI0025E2098F
RTTPMGRRMSSSRFTYPPLSCTCIRRGCAVRRACLSFGRPLLSCKIPRFEQQMMPGENVEEATSFPTLYFAKRKHCQYDQRSSSKTIVAKQKTAVITIT